MRLISSILCISAIILFAGCGMYTLESSWNDREIKVDGIDSDGEWENARFFLEEEKCIIGLLNDGEALTIRLSSISPQASSLALKGGMDIWFDPAGGQEKVLGIRLAPVEDDGSFGTQRRKGAGKRAEKSNISEGMAINLTSEVTLCYGKTDRGVTLSQREAAEKGINISANSNGRNLVIEMRIPLTRTDITPYAISEGELGKTIGVGFESRAVKILAQRERRNGSRGRSGGMNDMRSGGRNMGGMNGGRSDSGSSPVMPDMIELWLKVKLAAEES